MKVFSIRKSVALSGEGSGVTWESILLKGKYKIVKVQGILSSIDNNFWSARVDVEYGSNNKRETVAFLNKKSYRECLDWLEDQMKSIKLVNR